MSGGYGAAFDWVQGHVDAGRIPTAVLGIATADGTVALDAFGSTNGRAARATDPYWLFSITKALTGLTAARAIERGLLTTQTPLSDAIPDFGSWRDDVVRLGHLLSHTSGIPDPSLDPAEGLPAALRTPRRDFAAGAASRYSTIAFEGAAELIRHSTGKTWDAGVAEWADPLGATGFTLDPDVAPHDVVDAAAQDLDMVGFARHRNAGAGMIGTASDLLALGSALLRVHRGERDGVVQPETLAMMRRPLTAGISRLDATEETGEDWGLSFKLRTRAPGLIDRDVFGHSGWPGTEFWVHPTAGVAYVLLTNQVERVGVDLDAIDNAVVSAR